MITGQSAAFTAMVEGVSQEYGYRVQMTLPAGPYGDFSLAMSAIQIDGQTTTDLPAQSRLQAGIAYTTATFTLAGLIDPTDSSKTAAWLFGKFSTTSPLYRLYVEQSPITIDLGLYPAGAAGIMEPVRKFTGFIDGYTQLADGSVQFRCVDNHGAFRNAVTTPAVITAPPFNAGMTSEFPLDAVLRQGSGGAVSSWPAIRSGCVLAAGMRSSLWPEVGTLSQLSSYLTPSFVAGKNGSAVRAHVTTVADSITYQTADFPITAGVFIEFWVTNATDAGGTSMFTDLGDTLTGVIVEVAGGQIAVGINVNGTPSGVVLPTTIDATPHYIGVYVKLTNTTTQWSGTAYVDGATYPITTQTVAVTTTGTHWGGLFIALGNTAIEALQVSSVGSAPASNYTFVPQAVLDPSLNPLTVVPQVTGQVPDLVQQIAEAELGVCLWDELGVFRFYNRKTLLGRTSSRTITSDTALEQLQVDAQAASVVNRAQIPYSAWSFATAATTVYEATTAIRIPGGGSKTFSVTLSTPAVGLDVSPTVLANGSTDQTASYFRASTSASGLVERVAAGLDFTIVQLTTQTASVTIKNRSTLDAYLVSPAAYIDLPVGTPLFRIAGTAVTAGDSQTTDYQYPWLNADGTGGAKSTHWGEVVYQAQDAGWVQDADAALQLAVDVVGDGFVPRPDLTNVTIVPDPRLQRTDRVRIQDNHAGTYVDMYASLFGLNASWSADSSASYDQTIDARTVQAPGRVICGDPVLDICGGPNDY